MQIDTIFRFQFKRMFLLDVIRVRFLPSVVISKSSSFLGEKHFFAFDCLH